LTALFCCKVLHLICGADASNLPSVLVTVRCVGAAEKQQKAKQSTKVEEKVLLQIFYYLTTSDICCYCSCCYFFYYLFNFCSWSVKVTSDFTILNSFFNLLTFSMDFKFPTTLLRFVFSRVIKQIRERDPNPNCAPSLSCSPGNLGGKLLTALGQ